MKTICFGKKQMTKNLTLSQTDKWLKLYEYAHLSVYLVYTKQRKIKNCILARSNMILVGSNKVISAQ